ncbi:MAG: AEC family transporter [Chloroflexota bacterium]
MPVLLVVASGYFLGRNMVLDSRTIGRILFYLATPSLVFRSLYQTKINISNLQNLALISICMVILTGTLGWLTAFREERRRRAAVTLASAVANNGNMGIPISLFAFGEAGAALGTLYYVVTSFCSNTLGSVVASAGSASVGKAVSHGLRVPTLYAAIGGLALNWLQWELPTGVVRAADLMGGAAVPGMLILMGVQLSSVKVAFNQQPVYAVTLIRLLVAPILAWGLCLLLGVNGLERDIIILQASMPTAVMVTILVTEFDAAPRLVAAIIFFSTLCSIVSLSVLLWILL